MRNKRRVLLLCADDEEMSAIRFMLNVNQSRVLAGISAYPPLPNVVLVVDDGTLGMRMVVNAVGRQFPDVQMLVKTQSDAEHFPVHARLLRDCSHLELLARLKAVPARKPGPCRRVTA